MTQPNILLINCDDLGYGDLGCYGSELNQTPVLDQLAAEGLRLTDFYMASPVCSPSRGAMMTGCYPPRIGFDTFDGRSVLFPGQAVGLNPSERTLALTLKGAGYATKLIGKWHCGDQPEFLPTEHGFDSYFGLPFSNDMGRQPPDPNVFPPLPLLENSEVIEQQPDQSTLLERYLEKAVGFIKENATRDTPFFLYFAHFYVHLPICVPERFLKDSQNGRYGAAVACIDWAMEVLWKAIREAGIDANTLIIFTSDNGSRVRDEGGSNAPCRGTKATTWEGGLRVPCIARWPGKIPAGTVSSEVFTAMDFLPTFAALADAPLSSDNPIDGRDIRNNLFLPEETASPHEVFLYYFRDQLEAVRMGPWKLHFHKEGKPLNALHNLQEDPGETTDRFHECPEVVKAITRHAEAARNELGDSLTGAEGSERRPIGRSDNPAPLTAYDPNHPYTVAMYDLSDRG